MELSLIERAKALRPWLRERAVAAEQLRRLPDETMAALRAAEFHKVYLPKRYGGFECDWGMHYELGRELGAACGAAAWTTSLVFSHILFAARFGAKAQAEFFGRRSDPILATGSAGAGVLSAVGRRPDAYVLSGRWGFVSGVHHADGVMVIAKQGQAPLFTHFVLLLPGEYTIEDTWQAEGLRGTGSHHIKVEAQGIPAHRVIERDELIGQSPPGSALHDSYLYRMRMAALQKSWFAGPLVGTARGVLDEYILVTRSRRGQIFGESVAEQVPVQVGIGESQAEIDAADVIARALCARLHLAGKRNDDVAGADLLRLRRDAVMVSKLALDAATRLSTMTGAAGQIGNPPVQRLFRDCRMISTHIELNWHYSLGPSGKFLLGLPTGDPLVDGGAAAPGAGPVLGTQI